MAKTQIDIERASNGSYIITWYKTLPNTLQKLGGTKEEKEQLAFPTIQELVKWLNKVI